MCAHYGLSGDDDDDDDDDDNGGGGDDDEPIEALDTYTITAVEY